MHTAMLPDEMTRIAAARARMVKALRLEASLRRAGFRTAEHVQHLSPADREGACRAAGVNFASPETWAMVSVLFEHPRETPEVYARQGAALDELARFVSDPAQAASDAATAVRSSAGRLRAATLGLQIATATMGAANFGLAVSRG